MILGRSSVSIKGIPIVNGVIDSDSMGEIIVIINVPVTWTFMKEERIAQLLLLPYVMPENQIRKESEVLKAQIWVPFTIHS